MENYVALFKTTAHHDLCPDYLVRGRTSRIVQCMDNNELSRKNGEGNFGHGFVCAGIGGAFSASGVFPSNAPARFIAATIIGGTISKLTDGKFANGAAGTAFAFLVSSIAYAAIQQSQLRQRLLGSPVYDDPSLSDALLKIDIAVMDEAMAADAPLNSQLPRRPVYKAGGPIASEVNSATLRRSTLSDSVLAVFRVTCCTYWLRSD